MSIKFPPWMKKKVPHSANVRIIKDMLQELKLNTVCQGAQCPNIAECFAQKTATFMILGDTCTRNCTFCAITKGQPLKVDLCEPERLAQAVSQMGLRHVVITSVTRDDLTDGGSAHFANTIRAVRQSSPDTVIEVLTPDFAGNLEAISQVVEARPDIFNHNLETAPRLYPRVRPKADYKRSLWLLQQVKKINPDIYTKSGLMVGLGEQENEILTVMDDLLANHCDILTIGQYLQPTENHIELVEFITPETFARYKAQGLTKGFKYIAAGPFVRSSYHAEEFSERHIRTLKLGGESNGS